MRLALTLALAPALALAAAAPAASAVRLDSIGRFDAPVHVAAPPGDANRVFVVEQRGAIRIVKGGRTNARPFLDIRSRVLSGGERGLLSMAFAPDYARSGRFYVYFTERPSGDIRVMEFHVSSDADVADPASGRLLFGISHSRFANHNGGQLAFGPDGLLYAGTGDGGGGGNPLRTAQNRRSLLGKILRIDAQKAGARPRVYALGLRNPYRFSFDRTTGDLIIGDVGQGQIEEVDFLSRGAAPGANFGWSVFEGTRRFSGGSVRNHRKPIIQHTHAAGWCAIIGGFVVRDRSVQDLYGRYVYGDNCQSGLYSARVSSRRARGMRRVGVNVGGLSSFGEDSLGRVYATSLAGPVYRLR
jgi:glucose/arabinose dehydrogenase